MKMNKFQSQPVVLFHFDFYIFTALFRSEIAYHSLTTHYWYISHLMSSSISQNLTFFSQKLSYFLIKCLQVECILMFIGLTGHQMPQSTTEYNIFETIYRLFLILNVFNQYFEGIFGIIEYKLKITTKTLQISHVDRVVLQQILLEFIENVPNVIFAKVFPFTLHFQAVFLIHLTVQNVFLQIKNKLSFISQSQYSTFFSLSSIKHAYLLHLLFICIVLDLRYYQNQIIGFERVSVLIFKLRRPRMCRCPNYEQLIYLLNHYYLQPLMAHVEVSKLSGQELAELACTYAALLLHDDQQDITGEKIGKLVTAAGVKIEPYWPKLFAKALQGQDITSFFNYGGSGSASAPAASDAAKPAPVAEKKAEEKGGKKQQKKKEAPPPPPEEEDVDMGDLFG